MDKQLNWRKASLSASNGGCVEIAHLEVGGVAMRDSKDPDRAPLVFTPYEWECFVDGIRKGEFNRK